MFRVHVQNVAFDLSYWTPLFQSAACSPPSCAGAPAVLGELWDGLGFRVYVSGKQLKEDFLARS